ncbi:hypothetical protein [Candidatus Solirubrobacter pratensis]|uniref:hypothetical protein n=1 Tax=Candidatus Solirubrobacter pratensis TaxID=1298857 RepID=UPI00040FBDB9|nr:hypothetical protein [Candidatus Solirubrobacter pratensis]
MPVITQSAYQCPDHGLVSDNDARFADWYCPTCKRDLEEVECVLVTAADWRGAVGEPVTMYRYGDEWTSVERGYPHQDADERAEFARLGGQ